MAEVEKTTRVDEAVEATGVDHGECCPTCGIGVKCFVCDSWFSPGLDGFASLGEVQCCGRCERLARRVRKSLEGVLLPLPLLIRLLVSMDQFPEIGANQ